MHFFSLFGPTFHINTTSTNRTSQRTTTPIENTQTNSIVDQGSISNMVPPELQSILQSILPGFANTLPSATNTSANNNSTTNNSNEQTNPPNNGIIMVYEDISAQQSLGLDLTEIHQVSHLLLNEKVDETEEETKTCSICQQNIEWDSIIRRINICNHEYHVNCIDQWLVDHNTCPTCRRVLLPNNENSNTTEERNVNSPVSSYQFRIPLRNNHN